MLRMQSIRATTALTTRYGLSDERRKSAYSSMIYLKRLLGAHTNRHPTALPVKALFARSAPNQGKGTVREDLYTVAPKQPVAFSETAWVTGEEVSHCSLVVFPKNGTKNDTWPASHSAQRVQRAVWNWMEPLGE